MSRAQFVSIHSTLVVINKILFFEIYIFFLNNELFSLSTQISVSTETK